MFPGDLPDDPEALFTGQCEGFKGLTTSVAAEADYRFLRVRPPAPEASDRPVLPHIRLDRALQFLLGDHLA
jgi:predicted YcjX-like family ATPase